MSLGVFSELYNAMLTAFGSQLLVIAFLAIGIVALIAVTVRVNALISLYLAAVPFVILLIYGTIAGIPWVMAGVVLIMGSLLGFAFYNIFNR